MSEEIKLQYKILNEIKKVEEKVFRLEKELNHIPEEERALVEGFEKVEAEFNQATQAAEQAAKEQREAEMMLKTTESELEKAQSKLMEAKTNEAYQAGEKEIETKKEEKAAIEEKLIKILSLVEETKAQLEVKKKEFDEQNLKCKGLMTEIEEGRKKARLSLEKLEKERLEHAKELNAEAKTLYRRVSRAPGPSVVYMSNGQCEGCRMKVLPQVHNLILGSQTLTACPACKTRMLILPPQTDE